jgi:hypothetical protein
MRVDNFLAQRVLCYMGQWITCRQAIKYMANFASGVHSNNPVTPEDLLTEQIRGACSYEILEGQVRVHILRGFKPADGAPSPSTTITFKPAKETPDAAFKPEALDPVLVEMLAVANMLSQSPDISRLQDLIREEQRS